MVKAGLKKLDLLGHLGERVREACRTDFLYWSRSMIPAHLQNIYTQPATANRLHVHSIPSFKPERKFANIVDFTYNLWISLHISIYARD